MSTTTNRARVALGNLAGRLTAEQMRQTEGGHVYGGIFPLVICPKRRLHFGFFNVRRVFGRVCRRTALRFGLHTV